MKFALTLTQRYLLFLAAIITAFIIGSQVITSHVVKSGLVEMFRQRFSRAQVVLEQYTDLHRYTRSRELEAVLTSPRFLATLATEDSGTIAIELPAYEEHLDADFLAYFDLNRQLSYVTNSLPTSVTRQLQSRRLTNLLELETDFLTTDSLNYELHISQVTTSDGLRLGWLVTGNSISQGLAADLRQLTGFDVIISHAGRIIGHSSSPLIATLERQGKLQQLATDQQLLSTLSIEDEEIILSSSSGLGSATTVTFLGSLDEHIDPIKSEITTYLLLFAAGGGLLAMLVIYLVTSRQIGRQVTNLVQAAERIASGQTEFQIEPLSKDELGFLAGEFEKMRRQIAKHREEIEKAYDASLRSERLAAIGKLATGIIHDFKSPMAVIRGTVELIQRKDPANNKLVAYCGTIQGQVDRMVDLARDVIDYSRGESRLDLSPVDLTTYFAEIREFHSGAYQAAGIQLLITSSPHVTLTLDPNRFRRVVDNILNNAREALKPGDQVEISWRLTESSLQVEIADNGPGIPEAIREHLFEPFVTSNKEGGTGLGLAITKKIVDDHGGAISVVSAPGQGSCFVVALPRALTSPARTDDVVLA
ncbi:MAG: HAMP domain-containing protein [bacterium]|nr:HAMP domain-containing protein [bacterium]